MIYFLSNIPEIKLNSDVLFNVGPFGINNSMMAIWVCGLFLIGVGIFVRKNINLIPGKIQILFEEIYTFMYDKLVVAFGSEKDAKRFAPHILTIFLIYLIANQFSLIPLLSNITTNNGNLFRTPTADFSLPIAVALLTVGIAHMIAFSVSPIRHIGNFIKIHKIFEIRKLSDIPNTLLEIFLGLLDIVGEIAKVVSLSARLFGNVVAGELMVIIITYLATFTNFLVPIPFIFLSTFSGVVQAFVFPLLSIQYLGGTICSVREQQQSK